MTRQSPCGGRGIGTACEALVPVGSVLCTACWLVYEARYMRQMPLPEPAEVAAA